MTTPRFVQIHSLIAYSAALLNRDDSGLAKRLPFGGATRTRISSQCLKRHWRMGDDDWALKSLPSLTALDFATRSRDLFSRAIVEPLVEEGFGRDLLEAISSEIQVALKVKKAGKGKSSGGDEGEDEADIDIDAEDADKRTAKDTEQAFMLGHAEIEYLKAQVKKIAQGDDALRQALKEKPKGKQLSKWQKDIKKLLGTRDMKGLRDNLAAMGISVRLPRGLEAALFGRMVTSDLVANTDAAIHVAHAFTVHREEAETDYFTVVDDLAREGETGAGGIFDTEITAGLFYVYVVVDVPLLIANLADDAQLAGKVVEHLVHLIATISPGAKKGSTAPYAYADLIFVESGTRQPRSLANAFREACKPTVADATAKLAAHLSRIDAMYGANETRRVAALDAQIALPGTSGAVSLDALAKAIAAEVAGV